MLQHGSHSQTILKKTTVTALVPIWDSGEQTFLLRQDRTFRAGRDRDCDLVIAHPGVALWHATLVQEAGQVSICPEAGQHLWINDQLVEDAAPVRLGDTLAIGPATFRIEERRTGRRIQSTDAGSEAGNPSDLSSRLEKQLSELQDQYGTALHDSDSSQPIAGHGFGQFMPSFSDHGRGDQDLRPNTPGFQSASRATPFMDFTATTNRRTALDERESQLNEWHRSLDRRREELDRRSANLTRQQATLSARQTELDQRTAELESWHQEAMEDIEQRKASVKTVAEEEICQRRDELLNQEQDLLKEQAQVTEQLRRMEESRQSIADQLHALEDARRALKEERAELAEERSQLESESRARQQADSEQEEAFREQRQKLDEFAQRLEGERDALQQQEASLRDEQDRLESRNTEVAEAEERIQFAATQPEVSGQTGEVDSEATRDALLLLEEQKLNLKEQQIAIERQLASVQRREDEVELLRVDVEAQRHELSDEQVALEFERAEASNALEEAHRLQQEIRGAQIEAADEPTAADEALRLRELELAERTQELAGRLADLKSLKKQMEEREQSVVEMPHAPATENSSVDRPKSVIASQLSSLLMPPGPHPEADGLQNSAVNEELVAVKTENADLQSERDELRDRVAELDLQLQAAEHESNSLSSLLTESELPISGRALTEQNLLAELQALKSELSEAHDQPEADGSQTGEQVVVQSQIAELEARNQHIVDVHAQEVQKYEVRIEQLNEQLGLMQKQFEDLEERAMQAVAAPASPASVRNPDAVEVDHDSEAEADSVKAEEQENAEDGDAVNDSPVIDEGETVLKLKQMVEQLSTKLEQRNNTIDNLQAQLNGGIPVDASASMTPQEVKVLSQELDSRTVLLDEREAALRERERLLEQSEQELQVQRVALQEARQQLELARAEIHSAREPAASESMLVSRDLIDSVTELAEAGATNAVGGSLKEQSEVESDDEEAVQQSSVRSEIAELFGLGGKSKVEKPVVEEKKAPSTAAELMEAVDDYSQESAAAVSLSFESAQDMLMKPDSVDATEQSFQEEASESAGADDVVASYMEQLLSRSRAKADGDGPSELQNSIPKPVAKPEPEKKPAGQASFIDKYMSGQYDAEKPPEAVVEAEAPETTAAEDQLVMDQSAELRRSKIDRDALRNDLQSFRELSTKSAANALATHARRQQKGGITTRTTIVTTLGLICVFVLAAALIGVIPFGWLTTLSVIAVAASAAELGWKLKQIQSEVEERTRLAGLSVDAEPVKLTAGSDDMPSDHVEAAEDVSTSDTELAMEPSDEVSVLTTETSSGQSQSDSPIGTEQPVLSESQSPACLEPVASELAADESETPESPLMAPGDQPEVNESHSETPMPASEAKNDVGLPTSNAGHDTPADPAEVNNDDQHEKEKDGTPDAFNEAFRMLTSTSFPVEKPSSVDENAAP